MGSHLDGLCGRRSEAAVGVEVELQEVFLEPARPSVGEPALPRRVCRQPAQAAVPHARQPARQHELERAVLSDAGAVEQRDAVRALRQVVQSVAARHRSEVCGRLAEGHRLDEAQVEVPLAEVVEGEEALLVLGADAGRQAVAGVVGAAEHVVGEEAAAAAAAVEGAPRGVRPGEGGEVALEEQVAEEGLGAAAVPADGRRAVL